MLRPLRVTMLLLLPLLQLLLPMLHLLLMLLLMLMLSKLLRRSTGVSFARTADVDREGRLFRKRFAAEGARVPWDLILLVHGSNVRVAIPTLAKRCRAVRALKRANVLVDLVFRTNTTKRRESDRELVRSAGEASGVRKRQ
jgi:hypothetical protein